MNYRHFHLRLGCNYQSTDNTPIDLVVEIFTDGAWQAFEPRLETPGFLLFVYALFSCQLRYMRVNSVERGFVLQSTSGELTLVADADWAVQSMQVDFRSQLKNGTPCDDDITYIRERMRHCPVSTNLPASVVMNNSVVFT